MSATTVTIIGEFFDYALYAADRLAPLDVTHRQGEGQEEDNQVCDEHDRGNIIYKISNREQVLREEKVTAQEIP